MIYIVSGTSRAGKTIVAKKISEQTGLPYFSVDWLVMGFGNGIPDYGIHHMMMPDVIAKNIWSFLKAMCEAIILNGESCVIDGEALLPELVYELTNKFPDDVKVVFLGFTEISLDEKVKQVQQYAQLKKDWISDKSKEYIRDHVKNMLPHSKEIRKSCKKYNIKYFDTSKNFERTIEDVVEYLLDQS
ncbi:MAG: hypothetical protein RI564_12560 [Gracilimonas sp.]|nr:hypothetical protein [Gracilimonas sp.]